MWLIMPQYPWISLNIFEKDLILWFNSIFWFWPCQGSGYAWSSYMFDKLLKMAGLLNMLGSWIWYGCICKGYREFWICQNMVQHSTIMPESALMSFGMPEHG